MHRRVPFAFNDFLFDEARLELSRDGERLKVDAQVLRFLGALLLRPGEFVSKEELIASAWDGRHLGDNVISVCAAKLRKVLGGEPNSFVQNAYGRGYRFVVPVRQVASRSTPPGTAQLVGRTGPANVLERAMQSAERGGGGVFVLMGEAGIGKTALAEDLARSLRGKDVGVAFGRCLDTETPNALGPWLEIAQTVAPSAALPGTPRDVEGDANTGTWPQTVQWFMEFCRTACSERTWLFVLDDAQWADAASLALLARLCREVSDLPLLVIVTVRDTDRPESPHAKRHLDDAIGHRNTTRLTLSRLAESDVADFVTQARGAPDPELARAIFAKSEGNPFFMVELLRDAESRPPDAQAPLSITGKSLEILRKTLRHLPDETQQELALAATIGRRFELGLLALASERDAGTVLTRLAPALEAGTIVPEGGNLTILTFSHDLTRAALYDELPQHTRASLHAKVAGALAQVQKRLGKSANAELAHHLLAALPYSDAAEAMKAARQAARVAQSLGAHADACALLRKALTAEALLLEERPALTGFLRLELAQAERAAGDPAFLEQLADATRFALRHRLGGVLAEVGHLMAGSPGTVPVPGAPNVLEAARTSLPAEDSGTRARVLGYLTNCPPYAGDATQVAALLDEAEVLAQNTPGAMLTILRQRLYFASGPGDEAKARAMEARMVRLIESAPRYYSHWYLALQFDSLLRALQKGDLPEAERQVAAYGAAAHRFRHMELQWHHARIETVLRMHRGELEYARTRFLALTEEAEQQGLHARADLQLTDLLELRRYTEAVPDSPAASLQRLHAADAAPPNIFAGRLRAVANLGALEEARQGLASIPPASLLALPRSRDYLCTLAHLASVSTATGLKEHSAVLYDLLAPFSAYFAVSISFHQAGSIELHLARLARSLGQETRAISHFEAAIVAHESLGLRPIAAGSRVELARALRSVGAEPARARTLLASARDTAIELGMHSLLRAIADA
ncbi:MAG: hypothetical protein RL385_845 [Pseudomonadota bacterium]|jgi:DNA-binding winged helix-turn-helix (wHTH) protein